MSEEDKTNEEGFDAKEESGFEPNEDQDLREGLDAVGKQAEEAEEKTTKKRRKKSTGVPKYAEADDNIKGLMDELIADIADDPTNIDLVIEYGIEPMEELGKVADELIRVQQQWHSASSALSTPLSRITQQMKDVDFGSMKEKLAALAESTANKGKGMFDWLTSIGKKKKKGQEEEIQNEIEDKLPMLVMEMNQLVTDLEQANDDMDRVAETVNDLGKARMKAVRELAYYINAGDELQRRYNEEWIPQAQQDLEESGDIEDEEYLQNLMSARDMLAQQNMNLVASRAGGIQAGASLRTMITSIASGRQKIHHIMTHGVSEWKGMLAQAGITATHLKISRKIKEADQFGDDLHDENIKMLEDSQGMLHESLRRGAVDPKKIIEGMQQVTNLLEKSREEQDQHMKLLESQKAAMEAASDDLVKATKRYSGLELEDGSAFKRRELESGKPKKKPANDDKSGKFNAAGEKKSKLERLQEEANGNDTDEPKAAPKKKANDGPSNG